MVFVGQMATICITLVHSWLITTKMSLPTTWCDYAILRVGFAAIKTHVASFVVASRVVSKLTSDLYGNDEAYSVFTAGTPYFVHRSTIEKYSQVGLLKSSRAC